MTTHDRISIGGFVSLGAPVVALGGLMFLQIDDVDSRIGGCERIERFDFFTRSFAGMTKYYR